MPFNLYEVWKSVDTEGVEPRRGVVTAIDPEGNAGQLLLDIGESRSISWPLHEWEVDTSPKPTLSANELRQKILEPVHRQPACPGEMDVEVRGTRENDWEAIAIPPPGQPLAYTDCAAYISSLARAFHRLYGLRTMPDEEVLPPGWMNSDRDANDTVVRMSAERQRNFFAATQSGAVELFPPGVPQSPESSAPAAPSVVEGAARGSSFSSGFSSGFGSPVVSPGPSARVISETLEERLSVEQGLSVEQRLSERPADIREAARALSGAIADQIDRLNASKPNDPDALTRQDDFIAFLRGIAAGLDELATALDEAIKTDSPETRRSFLASAAATARGLRTFVTEGIEEHRAVLKVCAVQVPLLGACVWLMTALGVSPNVAFIGISAIMGVKAAFPGGSKE